MHVLILEAYDGGSHARFLDGLVGHSRHRFTRLSLPARKWKWRMRGSAIHFARELGSPLLGATSDNLPLREPPDLILTSDMTAVADLRALLPPRWRAVPLVVYFHENQLTYPVPDESERDYQYAFTNLTSCLAADAAWFNSAYHLDEFLAAIGALLRRMPDYVPSGLPEALRSRAVVFSPGLEPILFERRLAGGRLPNRPATLLWNHRWEYDKNPSEFFQALFELHGQGVPFRLLLAGETFRTYPEVFDEARDRLADRIDHFGYLPDRQAYLDLLARADVAVSTAIHEFYGLSVLEAIAAGCYPVLPRRLSYPELVPRELHELHLYSDPADLRDRLRQLCLQGVPALSKSLIETVAGRAWPVVIGRFDAALEETARRGRQ